MKTNRGSNYINDVINKSNSNKSSMTKCQKGGVKIKEAGNGYKEDPFDGVNPFNIVKEERNQNVINALSLNVDNVLVSGSDDGYL